jgi:hypothetical protein
MATPRSQAFNMPAVFDESAQYITGEHRLMMAVIVTAVNDALGISPSTESDDARDREQRIARRWFEDNGADYQAVCHHAGLEPASLRTAVLAFIAERDGLPRRQRALSSNGLNAFNRQRKAA